VTCLSRTIDFRIAELIHRTLPCPAIQGVRSPRQQG
jgi:hypothetical protein